MGTAESSCGSRTEKLWEPLRVVVGLRELHAARKTHFAGTYPKFRQASIKVLVQGKAKDLIETNIHLEASVFFFATTAGLLFTFWCLLFNCREHRCSSRRCKVPA